jgi:hypothetical protein
VQRLETLVARFAGIAKAHTHDFYMLLYIRQNTGTHTIDFVTYPVRPGHLFCLAPDQLHSWDLSIDSIRSHIACVHNVREKSGVYFRFPIIADLDMKVARLYGMLQPRASATAACFSNVAAV